MIYIHYSFRYIENGFKAANSEAEQNEESISQNDGLTDNDTVSFQTSNTAGANNEKKGKSGKEDRDDASDDSDFYDGDILKSYLKMLHDSLVKAVIIALVHIVNGVVVMLVQLSLLHDSLVKAVIIAPVDIVNGVVVMSKGLPEL